MRMYAIADLHLSFSSPDKAMDIFGGQWIEHWKKVMKNWDRIVEPDDLVIIPGDISWALKFEDALEDIKWIHERPGKKILVKGNHDLWWTSISKLNALYSDVFFLQNNFAGCGNGWAVCGTRGWVCPGDREFSEHDEKIYKREILRLESSLLQAKENGYEKIIGVLHYPPTNEKHEESGFTELFSKYNVANVVYGHLHGPDVCIKGLQGVHNGVNYILTSLDHVRAIPKLIV